MEVTAREFNQNASQILSAAEHGESVTVTKNGRQVARLTPMDHKSVPAYPPGPIGEIELPRLDLGPDMTDEELDGLLDGMGEDGL
ncbi:type II toxin-antitoxin system Phd/YefM family antitoxin [Streptomyces sp. KLOTTS4A1]|uniref:type II toxin-antitoxin system Phd/YefM family antitoxin n=1 Tax=Streptomyces sp. KLOTTS4A1 TaxID=3390996 RepID=UPI0039F537E0